MVVRFVPIRSHLLDICQQTTKLVLTSGNVLLVPVPGSRGHGNRLLQKECGRDVSALRNLDCHHVVNVLQSCDLIDDTESEFDELKTVLHIVFKGHFLDTESCGGAVREATIIDGIFEDSLWIINILVILDEDFGCVSFARLRTVEGETESDAIEVQPCIAPITLGDIISGFLLVKMAFPWNVAVDCNMTNLEDRIKQFDGGPAWVRT
ncbi:hypothetical protein L207DRAFT_35012 [Hyaloscypha variabilis F]|uniref:Uncharacterized protein n=1 Tax=Hyaloscypha variabilis (strain UAMH 11265 / GT02V1 / F) TaxID=1149755 RepID=A0A2J6RN98_HYAVF|nr:hypothetical protein L207DRAFT_35012 [Hyaloscypha variabilis F]